MNKKSKIVKTAVIALILFGATIAIGACLRMLNKEAEHSSTTVGSPRQSENEGPTNDTERRSEREKKKSDSKHTSVASPITQKTQNEAQSQSIILDSPVHDTEMNVKRYDLSSLKMNQRKQPSDQIVRYAYPSFNPDHYEVNKHEHNPEGTDFSISYSLKVGEYVTSKGYTIIYENSEAIELKERGASFSVPDGLENGLPAITDEIIQAAYQQGREKLRSRNADSVIAEQSGFPYLDLRTSEFFYTVSTIYIVAGDARGVVTTRYKIA